VSYTRPTRGAVRLDDVQFDVDALKQDLELFPLEDFHKMNGYGDLWGHVQVIRPDGKGGEFRDPRLEKASALQKIMDRFPARTLDMSIAKLGPGAKLPNHRDISGGVPMGVARFHVPVITDPKVEFFVSDNSVRMAPGETWNLDTTYVHRVENNTEDVWRLHVIIDVELNDAVRKMLPKEDWVDKLHKVHFSIVCFWKGVKLMLRDPRQLIDRLIRMFRLRVLGESQLTF